MISYLKRLFRKIKPTPDNSFVIKKLLDRVSGNHSAIDIREEIDHYAKYQNFTDDILPIIIKKIVDLNWSKIEIEKVRAYADFSSGANAAGYNKVIEFSLAQDDYLMAMTAYRHCYAVDRFPEGISILDIFQPNKDPKTNWCEYLVSAGSIRFHSGQNINEVLPYFDQALERQCKSPMLATNAYVIYFEAGRLKHCEILHEMTCVNYYSDPDAIISQAFVELARGFYGEGFRLLEMRYLSPDISRWMNQSLLKLPRWENQNLAGKRILIHGEQGLGDMIMMVRFLPSLMEQNAEIVIDGRIEMASLIEYNFPYCKYIITNLQSTISERFDYWTGIFSLPFHFQTSTATVPETTGYIAAPVEQKNYWKDRIKLLSVDSHLRVGLTWSGNPDHRADKRRSIPFAMIATLIERYSDVHFFSLQTHVPTCYLGNLIDVSDELLTFADTAAAIEEMDLLISVDTSVIHLAGALGHPAWLLLPFRYEWRWGLDGQANPWYASVRVFRQNQHGNWSQLLDMVGAELQSYIKSKQGGQLRV